MLQNSNRTKNDFMRRNKTIRKYQRILQRKFTIIRTLAIKMFNKFKCVYLGTIKLKLEWNRI